MNVSSPLRSRKRLERAVKNGDARMISFGAVDVMTMAEIERIRALYGITEYSEQAI